MMRSILEDSVTFEYSIDVNGDKVVQDFLEFMRQNGKKALVYRAGKIGTGTFRFGTSFDLNLLVKALTDPRPTYDPKYGDETKCADCGHTYYRHFDTYAHMEPVGCKYCPCQTFKAPVKKKSATTPRRNARSAR